jgi:integrase/recombinase XerD
MLAKDTLEEFKLECELRRLTPRTIKGYYNSTLLFLNWLERQQEIKELEAIRPQHIKQYIQYLIKKQLTPSYINSILRCIRAYFRYATEEEYLTSNPATKISWQKQGKVIIEAFTDEEVRSLLEVFDFSTFLSARNKLVLAIAFDTGARNTEMCDILEEDVRDNVILLHGKGNKERHVPLTPYLKRAIIKYKRMLVQGSV